MKSLYSMSEKNAKKVKALLFDLDGTFVSDDKLASKTYESLENLRNSGIKTIAVTGRPAGWCDLMARWWPIDAVVGENGAFFYKKVDNKIVRETYHPPDNYSNCQEKLKSLFGKLLKKYDYLKLASDQPFRHWDLAIDISEETNIPMEIAIDIVSICHNNDARAAISNIHVNIWFGDYNKETMSLKVLDNLGIMKDNCVYIGDSPNDSPMFDCFPLSVGVKSVENYKDIMNNLPEYITDEDGAIGFIELVKFIS